MRIKSPSREWKGDDFLSVLYAVAFFSTLGVVESIQSTHQITGDSSNSVEFLTIFRTPALRAGVADDSVIPANGITIYGVIDGAITVRVCIRRLSASRMRVRSAR